MRSSSTASWVFDETTMSRGRHWHWFKTPWLCCVLPFLGVLLIVFGTFILSREDDFLATPWVLIVMGCYFILRYWIIGFRFRRDLRKNPHYGKEMQWIFTEDGFQALMAGSEVKSDWSGFYETFITPDGFLLYPQKGIYYWIPKSAFTTSADSDFVETILQHKTHAKLKG